MEFTALCAFHLATRGSEKLWGFCWEEHWRVSEAFMNFFILCKGLHCFWGETAFFAISDVPWKWLNWECCSHSISCDILELLLSAATRERACVNADTNSGVKQTLLSLMGCLILFKLFLHLYCRERRAPNPQLAQPIRKAMFEGAEAAVWLSVIFLVRRYLETLNKEAC